MLGVIKHNLKLLITPNYIIGWFFIFSIPFFISFKYLNPDEMVKITEQIFILVGIIWFGNLLEIEKKSNLEDLIFQMPVKQTKIFMIRFAIILINIFIGFSLLLVIAKIQNAVFNFEKLLFGSIIGASLLGLICITINQLGNKVGGGYLLSFAYYYLELITKGSITGKFYLFGLIYKINNNKILLLGVCLLIIFGNYLLLNKKINGNLYYKNNKKFKMYT